ncbi:hypothetical protein ABEB36_015304 [Hypothenemus hampei]|uniref:Uncharacterized protein n=1 Tax=Hypothenemus hampei TaxID=57062 RepID=A0ABD1E039_HYPHA
MLKYVHCALCFNNRFDFDTSSDIALPREHKLIHFTRYENLCLKTFIRGLVSQIQNTIRLRQPDSLETAMTYVQEEYNFQYTQNMSNTNPLPQFGKPNFNNYNKNHQNNAKFNLGQNRSFNNFSNPQLFPQQTNQFPRGPINIQLRQIPRHYPRNRQTFGPPRNVFKPTGITPTNVPEPMSTTSRNPTIQTRQFSQNNNGPNYYQNRQGLPFQNFGKQNLIAEEFYQMDQPKVSQTTENLPATSTGNNNDSNPDNQFYDYDYSINNNENFQTVGQNQNQI